MIELNGKLVRGRGRPPLDKARRNTHTVRFDEEEEAMIRHLEIETGINISDMTNKSKGEVAYTMLDIETAASEDIIKKLQSIDGVFRVRVVK